MLGVQGLCCSDYQHPSFLSQKVWTTLCPTSSFHPPGLHPLNEGRLPGLGASTSFCTTPSGEFQLHHSSSKFSPCHPHTLSIFPEEGLHLWFTVVSKRYLGHRGSPENPCCQSEWIKWSLVNEWMNEWQDESQCLSFHNQNEIHFISIASPCGRRDRICLHFPGEDLEATQSHTVGFWLRQTRCRSPPPQHLPLSSPVFGSPSKTLFPNPSRNQPLDLKDKAKTGRSVVCSKDYRKKASLF